MQKAVFDPAENVSNRFPGQRWWGNDVIADAISRLRAATVRLIAVATAP
jgi:hypothetical protein